MITWSKRDNVTKQDLKNNETVKAYQKLAESELRGPPFKPR